MADHDYMRAKSDVLAAASSHAKPKSATKRNGRRPTVRLPRAERRAQILSKACEFFAEYGLTAQTRALAEACGVSQRLLYSVFPNKAALLSAVYEIEVAGPIQEVWFVELQDSSKPMEQRLNRFYREYYDCILTRHWLRLVLYASLADVTLAPTYIAGVIKKMLEMIVAEAAREAGLRVPDSAARVQEIGWILHGAVSHLAIRRHIYQDATPVAVEDVVALHVKSFLGGLKSILSESSGSQGLP